jgi:hypothetical protein
MHIKVPPRLKSVVDWRLCCREKNVLKCSAHDNVCNVYMMKACISTNKTKSRRRFVREGVEANNLHKDAAQG